jgi:hypothetical protein
MARGAAADRTLPYKGAEMTHPKSQPTFSLCNADPKFPFSSDLLSAWCRGQFTDAAIAFLTEGGVSFFAHKCLGRQDRTRCRLNGT